MDFKLNAMDNLHEMNEQLKSLDQAEKNLQIDYWYIITIERINHKDDTHTKLFQFNFPKKYLDRWRWRVRYKVAQFQCLYPRDKIESYFSCYDRNHNLKGDRAYSIASCKAWVTRLRNEIKKYEEERAAELFWEKENDEIYQKAIKKLAEKEEKLQQVIERELKNGTN